MAVWVTKLRTDWLTCWADKTWNSPSHHASHHWLQGKQVFNLENYVYGATHMYIHTHMHAHLHTHSPHTHSSNLLCCWRNVDQMAYIPLLSPTWEATLPPPPVYTLSKRPQTHLQNMDTLKGQLAHFCTISHAQCPQLPSKQHTHSIKDTLMTGTFVGFKPTEGY